MLYFLANIIAASNLHKALIVKDLTQTTVIGLGLLGGSISLSIRRSFSAVKTVGFTHRPSTQTKARKLSIATEIATDIGASVKNADLVVLATPINTFEHIFAEIADSLPAGCIVTDVGSTKVLPHRWAAKKLPSSVHYVGSHPIAGSEQRGVEFARDDLFDRAMCIVTTTKSSNRQAVATVKKFWKKLGCRVESMTPAEHDRILGRVSHLPHVVAAALINATDSEQLKFAGKGFIDTSRIASGPANIWTDILLTNPANSTRGIDKIIAELTRMKKAINSGNAKQTQRLLESARKKRTAMINYKMRKKELLS